MYTPTSFFKEEEGAIVAEPLIQDVNKPADVALGVRLLNNAWLTGGIALCLQVQRSSDGSSDGVGFDGDGNLDEAALLAWVGTGVNDHGAVAKWWDQSGQDNHFEATTGFDQMPLVVISGSILRLSGSDDGNGNELPTVRFNGLTNGNGQFLDSPSLDGIYDPEISLVVDIRSYNSNGMIMSELQNGYHIGSYTPGGYPADQSLGFGMIGSSNQKLNRFYTSSNTPGSPMAMSLYYGRDAGDNASRAYILDLKETVTSGFTGLGGIVAIPGTGPEFQFTIPASAYIPSTHDNFTIGRFPANPLFQNVDIAEVVRWSGSAAFDSASRQTCVENSANYFGIPIRT